MTRLRDAGNSLVVVEHDPQLMFAADRLLDIGPGRASGRRDRRLRRPDEVAAMPDSLTGAYLSGRKRVDTRRQPRPVDATDPRLAPARRCPAQPRRHRRGDSSGRLVCVTGVSGSGKSTLIQDVLYPAWQHFGKPAETPGVRHARRASSRWPTW